MPGRRRGHLVTEDSGDILCPSKAGRGKPHAYAISTSRLGKRHKCCRSPTIATSWNELVILDIPERRKPAQRGGEIDAILGPSNRRGAFAEADKKSPKG
jgi:hypothetical protein